MILRIYLYYKVLKLHEIEQGYFSKPYHNICKKITPCMDFHMVGGMYLKVKIKIQKEMLSYIYEFFISYVANDFNISTTTLSII